MEILWPYYEEPNVLLRAGNEKIERRSSEMHFPDGWHFEPHDAWKDMKKNGV